METKQYCRKVSFADEKSANDYLQRLSKTSIREVVPQRAYLCEKCNAWHLTSKKYFFDAKIEELKTEYQKVIDSLESQLKIAKDKIEGQKININHQANKITKQREKLIELQNQLKKYKPIKDNHFDN